MSGYLTLAKKAGKGHPDPSEDLVARRERKIEEAGRRGLLIRWSEHPTWIKLHDPLTGEDVMCIHGYPGGKGCYLCDPNHPHRVKGEVETCGPGEKPGGG